MKLKRNELRKMILNEFRMAKPAVSHMRSRAHPDFVRALQGESSQGPDPHASREIIMGLDRALSEPALSTSSNLARLYPNLSQHLRQVKDYLNGRGLDPGDIPGPASSTQKTFHSSIDANQVVAIREIFSNAGLTPSENEFMWGILDQSRDESEFIESSAYEKLFEYYSSEMPYGIQKARTGEPDMWILDRLENVSLF